MVCFKAYFIISYSFRSSYKHDSRDLYLYYSNGTNGGWWLGEELYGKKNVYIYAITTATSPTTGLKWGSNYNGIPSVTVSVQCMTTGCAGRYYSLYFWKFWFKSFNSIWSVWIQVYCWNIQVFGDHWNRVVIISNYMRCCDWRL